MKLSFVMFLAGAAMLAAEDKPMDTQRSTITIHVGKAGLFSAAGHEHWVSAPIISGTVGDAQVEFRVDTAKMAVKPDPKVDAKTQAQIQKDMEEMTLETAKYPTISFHSTHVEKAGDGWKVDGTLSLHGVTKPVSVQVTRSGDAYTGRAAIRQTDFAIKPVSVAGGAVKVKNEVEIEFQIFTKP
jgi:polyisoprenoid-binding protein YceI